MQRTYGNAFVQRLVQRKVAVSGTGDKYEQEADRVADAVVRKKAASISIPAISRYAQPRVRRMCAECEGEMERQAETGNEEEEEKLQRQAAPGGATSASGETEDAIGALQGDGQPLPGSVRADIEPRMGYDFGRGRIHADGHAARLARSVGALTFTAGRDIIFGAGEYRPETSAGKRLLAHELAHVVQQTSTERVSTRLLRGLPAEGTFGQAVWPYTRPHHSEAQCQLNVGPLVQREPLGSGGGAMGTYVAGPGDSLSLIAGYPNDGWRERLDQLIAANRDHPNIKNRTPDDPQYGWLEIGDVINIPWGAPGIPAPSASLPSTPPSPGTTPPAPPTLDLPANVRVLQAHLNLTVASIPVTGTFDPATGKALQLWQVSKGLQPSGVVDPATVEALLTDMVAADQHEFAIPLVADAEDLNTSDVVALRTAWTWNPAWGQGDVHVEWEGSLREIWVHKDAFSTRARLVAALQQGLAAVPVLGPAGPVPGILAPADEAAAIAQVSSRLGEPIAVAALRGIVGASPDTAVDAELVQRLADWQGPGLATGRLDDASLDRIVRTERSGRENSVIRLVMDAFDLGSNALVSVLFEEDYLRNKSIDAVTIEFSGSAGSGARPSIIYLGPNVFGSLAVLRQNIMHELVHVELSAQGTLQGKRGSPERALHEFLGEATEILAAPAVSVYDTVIMDGTRVLTNWQAMSQSDRATHWSTFEDVRTAVLQAIATVPAGDQDYAKYQTVKTDYCAVLPNNSVGAFCSPPAPNPKRRRK